MTDHIWQLQEAKNRFSELVNRALLEGPQIVSRRGEPVVVVLSKGEYEKIKQAETSLVEFFRHSPLIGVDLDLTRDPSFPRDTPL